LGSSFEIEFNLKQLNGCFFYCLEKNMAAASLGRLTLDLLVRLGSFEQGLNRAERQASQSASNMSDAFRGFGDQIRESLGGTQLGSLIGDVTTRLEGMQGSVLVATAGLAGLAAGSTVLAVAGLSKMAIETAKADSEMAMLAMRAKVGIENFQIFTYAAEQLGISQDQLGSIFADVQEKLGEFSATKGGGAADFFDALKNNTNMTESQIKSFGKTLQGKDGVEAVQLLKDRLDSLGASSQEQRFVFESLASDLGNLMPLFSEGGAKIEEYGKALQDAGVIKSKEAIQQSQILAAQTQAVNLQFQGAKNQLVQGFMPAMTSVAEAMFLSSKEGLKLQSVGDGLGKILLWVGKTAIGVSTTVQLLGDGLGGLIAISVQAAQGNFKEAAAIYRDSQSQFDKITADSAARLEQLSKVATGSSSKLTEAILQLNQAQAATSSGLKTNTKDAEENAKAKEAQAKAAAKAAKAQEDLNKMVGASALSGLRIKGAETIAGGGVRAYTAEFAKMTQDLLGDQLVRFTSLNDKYHQGKGGKHPIGQAFDFTVKDASDANQSIQRIQEMAKKYGFAIKTLNEYADPSKNATGGHVHVSVLGYKGSSDALKEANTEIAIISKANADATRIQEERAKNQLAINYKYATEEQKMAIDNQEAIKSIKLAYAEGDPSLQKYLDLQKAAYDQDVAAFEQAQQEKYDSYRNDFLSKMADAEDAISLSSIANKYGKGSLEFQSASLNISARKSKAGEYDDYTNSVNQINRDYNTPELEAQRYKLLEEAKAAHIANLKAMDVDYHDSAKQLVEDQQKSTLSMYGSLLNQASGVWSDMTNMVKQSSGEQSSAYKAMFLMQQIFAIGSALISTHLAAAQVMADPSALTLAQKAMYSKLILAMGYANVGLIAGQTIAGMAHNGIDNIPKEGTWLLDGGERVLNPQQNKDLTRYLNDRQGGDGVNVNINVPQGYTAVESRDANGNVTIDVVEKMIKKSWTNVGQPNSFESKQVQRNFNTSVKR